MTIQLIQQDGLERGGRIDVGHGIILTQTPDGLPQIKGVEVFLDEFERLVEDGDWGVAHRAASAVVAAAGGGILRGDPSRTYQVGTDGVTDSLSDLLVGWSRLNHSELWDINLVIDPARVWVPGSTFNWWRARAMSIAFRRCTHNGPAIGAATTAANLNGPVVVGLLGGCVPVIEDCVFNNAVSAVYLFPEDGSWEEGDGRTRNVRVRNLKATDVVYPFHAVGNGDDIKFDITCDGGHRPFVLGYNSAVSDRPTNVRGLMVSKNQHHHASISGIDGGRIEYVNVVNESNGEASQSVPKIILNHRGTTGVAAIRNLEIIPRVDYGVESYRGAAVVQIRKEMVPNTGVMTLSSDAGTSSFDRATGSFLSDLFQPGMVVTPSGFAGAVQSVIGPYTSAELTASNGTSSFDRAAGSFVSDGFAIGQVVTTSGFTGISSDTEYTITDLSATSMEVTPAPPDVAAVAATITILDPITATRMKVVPAPPTLAAAGGRSLGGTTIADPIDGRGHVIDGLKVGGGSIRETGNLDVACIQMSGNWGVGESIYGFKLHDLIIPNSFIDISVEAIKDDGLIIENVTCPRGIRSRRGLDTDSPPRHGRLKVLSTNAKNKDIYFASPTLGGTQVFPLTRYFATQAAATGDWLGTAQDDCVITQGSAVGAATVVVLPPALPGARWKAVRTKDYALDLSPVFYAELTATATATRSFTVNRTEGLAPGVTVSIDGNSRTVLAVTSDTSFTIPASESTVTAAIGDTVSRDDVIREAGSGYALRLGALGASFEAECTVQGIWETVAKTGTTSYVTAPFAPPPPFSATGGTETTDGSYTIHTFNSSGSFIVSGAPGGFTVEYLVIAGGGGALGSGGGGAGGYRTATGLAVGDGTHTVTIGAGGAGASNGSNSSLAISGGSTITCVGGGANGAVGGSGGGASYGNTGGAGTASEGNAGGNGGAGSGFYAGAGGGGASAVGANGNSGVGGGAGGAGTSSSITGAAVTRAGGGGGGSDSPGTLGSGGSGGGGTATRGASFNNGTANTGSGGGGCDTAPGANGGSGVVIIRHLTAP